MLYFYKILDFLLKEKEPSFSREIFYLLWSFRPGLSCLGLEPALTISGRKCRESERKW